MTEGAAYSGLPKRTSLGTNSASAAEKAIRVRVGRLRRAVNAAADGSDAAIAMNTFAALTIFETMTMRDAFSALRSFGTLFVSQNTGFVQLSVNRAGSVSNDR